MVYECLELTERQGIKSLILQGQLAPDIETPGSTGAIAWDLPQEGGWLKESDMRVRHPKAEHSPWLSKLPLWDKLTNSEGRGPEERRGILYSFILKLCSVIKPSVGSNSALEKVPIEKCVE